MTQIAAPAAAPTRLKELALGLAYAAMLHSAVRLGIADAIGEDGATVDEIAAAVEADPPTLARLLRGLALQGVFAEDGGGRFRHTDLSLLLRTSGQPSMANMVLWAGAAWAWDAWPRLTDAIRTGRPVVPDLYGKDFFTYLREDAGTDAAVFNRAMTQSSMMTSAAVADALDVTNVGTLADIGGGQGHLLRTLLTRHAGLRGVLFEMPSVIATALPDLRDDGPLAGRTSLVAGDCLAAVTVRADLYLVKQVLKWDFDSSVRVLRHIRDAAPPGARVVVAQSLIDDSPEPRYAAAMDLLLLLNVGGREHSLADFRSLFDRAGLTFTGVTPTRTSLRLIEATV